MLVLLVLPYHMILRQLGVDPAALKSVDTLTIPRPLLELLLRMLIVRAAFDEADYLARNQDIRAAVQAGDLRSGHEHFLSVGYLEGRVGGSPVVDENWYIHAYADVARAVAQGKIATGADHYFSAGVHEWRVPAADADKAIAAWRSVLIPSQAPLPPADAGGATATNRLAGAKPAVGEAGGSFPDGDPADRKPARSKLAGSKRADSRLPGRSKARTTEASTAKPATTQLETPITAKPTVTPATAKPDIGAAASDEAAAAPIPRSRPTKLNGSVAAKPPT